MESPTQKNVSIRIKVPFSKTKSFVSTYESLTHENISESIIGYTQEGGKHLITLGVPLRGNAPAALEYLSSLMVGLIDYYPSFAEQPSEQQAANREAFISHLTQKVPVS